MKDQLLRKLQDEITALDRELKLELPKEIKRARELGDLRENAEYHAAKERQTYVQARISMLQKRVERSADGQPGQDAARQARPSARRVHLLEATGPTVIFQLVMPEDADVEKGLDLHLLADRAGDHRQGSGRRSPRGRTPNGKRSSRS